MLASGANRPSRLATARIDDFSARNGVRHERRSKPGRSRESAQRDRRRRRSAAPPRRRTSFRPREKVTVYDFKRPERVGKEQMRALQTMHEGFGRNFGAALSALLRTMVEVKLTSVDQLTYSEFVFSLENPTCFNLITADAARRAADPRHQPVDPVSRSSTACWAAARRRRRPRGGRSPRSSCGSSRGSPTCFSTRCSTRGRTCCRWSSSVDRVESNPQLVQIIPANEVDRADQLRADRRRDARHDEPVHSVQLDRADQRQADVQQLGQLRASGRRRRVDAADRQPHRRGAGRGGRRAGRRRGSPPPTCSACAWATSSPAKRTSASR